MSKGWNGRCCPSLLLLVLSFISFLILTAGHPISRVLHKKWCAAWHFGRYIFGGRAEGRNDISPFNSGHHTANIIGIYADPAGQYLDLTTGAQNVAGAAFGYSISSNGNLTAASTQQVATPILPSSMAFGDDIR